MGYSLFKKKLRVLEFERLLKMFHVKTTLLNYIWFWVFYLYIGSANDDYFLRVPQHIAFSTWSANHIELLILIPKANFRLSLLTRVG